jgi:hypothetical protein
VLCALCHEDVWGSEGIVTPFLTSALDGGVSGQPHAPIALPPAKLCAVPLGQEAGRAPEPVWTLWRREKFCHAGNRAQAAQSIEDKYKTGHVQIITTNNYYIIAYFHSTNY